MYLVGTSLHRKRSADSRAGESGISGERLIQYWHQFVIIRIFLLKTFLSVMLFYHSGSGL